MDVSRAQGRHAGLTRDQVLRAAVELADRDGAAALSMRKLARELGVEAMTLYHHVRSKPALQDAIVEHVLAEAFGSAPDAASWQDLVVDYAMRLHRALTAHPGAVPLFASRPAVTTANLAELERLLHLLGDAGFPPRTALNVVHAVAGAVVGQHAALTVDASAASGADLAIDLADYPLFAEAVEAGPATVESRLEFTLRALVAGFERLLD